MIKWLAEQCVKDGVEFIIGSSTICGHELVLLIRTPYSAIAHTAFTASYYFGSCEELEASYQERYMTLRDKALADERAYIEHIANDSMN